MTASSQWLEMAHKINELVYSTDKILSDAKLQVRKVGLTIELLKNLEERCKIEAAKVEETETERAHGSTLLEEKEEIERGN